MNAISHFPTNGPTQPNLAGIPPALQVSALTAASFGF